MEGLSPTQRAEFNKLLLRRGSPIFCGLPVLRPQRSRYSGWIQAASDLLACSETIERPKAFSVAKRPGLNTRYRPSAAVSFKIKNGVRLESVGVGDTLVRRMD